MQKTQPFRLRFFIWCSKIRLPTIISANIRRRGWYRWYSEDWQCEICPIGTEVEQNLKHISAGTYIVVVKGKSGTASRKIEIRYDLFYQCYSAFLVPLHSGYDEQLQNSLPELMPFLATRFIIGFPHFGHNGASA